MDRVGDEKVRRRAGIERELASVVDQRVLRWCGHIEIMDEYRMAIKGVDGGSKWRAGRGRPGLGWMDSLKVALGNRGRGGMPWWICRVLCGHFCLVLVFFPTALPRSGALSPGEGWDADT